MEVILRGKLARDNEEDGFYLTDSEGRRVYIDTILEGFTITKLDTTISISGWTKVDESKLHGMNGC